MKFRDIIYDNLNKWLVASVLVIGILIILRLTTRIGYEFGVLVSLLPIAMIFIVVVINNPKLGFIILFITNYYISGISRYIRALPPGITMDIFFILIITIILLSQFNPKSEVRFKNSMNAITLISFIWLLYLVFEIFNPNMSSPVAWFTNVRGLGTYFILTAVVVSVLN